MTSPVPAAPLSLFSGPDAPDESELYKCVHCGFCLEACPTYVATGLETESPRGRIALMKAVHESRIDITPGVVRHWDLCIQCRACEVVCPSGVPYGRLIEATMTQVQKRRKIGMASRAVSWLTLRHVVPRQRILSSLTATLRLYQGSGIQMALRKSKLLRLVSPALADLESFLPDLPSVSFRAAGQVVPAIGAKRARVALLSGCVMPLAHGPQMNAVVRVLARNGCEVVVPKVQVCCGAINTHVGDLDVARALARRNVDAFLASGVDAIVVASAGCGSRMKEYEHLLRGDEEYAAKSAEFSGAVKDIHEFLVDLPFEPPRGELDRRVTYQDSCHLANAQRITDQPRALLRSIPGLELVELPNASQCCGAGGTYAITERESSLTVLEAKMQAVRDTGARIVATANPGCVFQLQYGAGRGDNPVEVCYVTDLLDRAYRLEPGQSGG